MIEPFSPKKQVAPYPQTTLDIETDDGDLLAIGMAWSVGDQIHYETFADWGEWLDMITDEIAWSDKETRKRITRIYAHNGGNFDWVHLLAWGHDTGRFDKMRGIMVGGTLIGVDIKAGKHTIRLRDSFRMLPGSLKSLSQSFDVPTPKQDISAYDIAHMREYLQNHPDKFYAYLEADVLALQQVLYRFWQMIVDTVGDIGDLPLTLASLAFRLWRQTLAHDIETPGDRLRAFERRGYTGGRTECYNAVDVENVRIYDANSLYPTVMQNGIFPTSYRGSWVAEYRGVHGMYECRFIQHDQTIPPLLRDEETHKFAYAGKGVYTKPEIDKLLELGGAVSVSQGYEYEETGPLFHTFITKWYGIRMEAKRNGDDALQYVAKILMNSSYGKFGQADDGEEVKLIPYEELARLLAVGTPLRVMERFTLLQSERNTTQTFVGIAAYITAYARLNLYEQMYRAVRAGGTLYATDTDSIHVGGYQMETGNDLGQWKLEYAGGATYLGKKLYALGDGTIKAKGIGKSAREKLTRDIFRNILETGEPLACYYETARTAREVFAGAKAGQFVMRVRRIRATAGLE